MLALALAGCLATGVALAQRQPIQFSSDSAVTVSNINQLRPQATKLQELEEALTRPFESLNPDSSLAPVLTPAFQPPARPIVRSNRDKQKEEFKKNWVFLNPDDLEQELLSEEKYGTKEYEKNGQEKKPKTALEKFYERLDRKKGRAGTAETDGVEIDNLQERDPFGLLQSKERIETARDDNKTSDPLLQEFWGSNADIQRESGPTALKELFGVVKVDSFQAARDSARDARMAEFKQLLETRSASPPVTSSYNPLNPTADFAPPTLGPSKTFGTFNAPPVRDAFPSGQSFGTIFQPAGIPDIKGSALGQSGFASGLQPAPAQKTPPPPNFDFPTRKF